FTQAKIRPGGRCRKGKCRKPGGKRGPELQGFAVVSLGLWRFDQTRREKIVKRRQTTAARIEPGSTLHRCHPEKCQQILPEVTAGLCKECHIQLQLTHLLQSCIDIV